ncbi:Putative AMP-activated kinase, glycogen-binding protein [Colletotrichum destructivum]|uniref:AMP-activated kinase, glycogen-binding protein n=1 Tax=Colletotrichum destructivum TaxID=34406 RepID=A0AAX4J0A9_9PEZI|nr:Putative AMP-activated kinase, glycogen-binding protein [Colletotrichum destructivum]
MGTYKFTWAHPAEEVYVTGTFDNWTKSEKLDKVGNSFEKTVTLPNASEKIYYKFVVDNNWITDHTAPQEPDHEGNVNNFLTPEQIVKEDISAATMSTVTPESTTAALAKDVPLEKKDDLPQATPSDIPGGFPITPAANELDKSFGVNPLPAQDVTAEPVTVAPGEPIPPSAKAGDINDQVKLDKEAYEDSSALPGLSKEETTLPAVTSSTIPESSLPIATTDVTINSAAPTSTTAALAAEVPVETKKSEVDAPESSLPATATDVTINSAAPASSTAALAAEIPLESKKAEVPEVVKESQEKAHAEPEASANPEAVQEKAVVEDELLDKVPTAPSTSEGTSGFGTQKTELAGTVIATAATAGGIAAAAVINAKDSAVEAAAPTVNQVSVAASDAAAQASVAATDAAAQLPEPVKESLPVSVQEAIGGQVKEETREEVAPEVPAVVKEAIVESGKSPEAAANTEAVVEKKEVEAELLKEVKAAPAVGEEAEKPKVEAAKEEVKETKEEVKEGDKSKTEAVKEEAKLAKEEVKDAVTDDSKKETNGVNGAHPATTANGTNGATLATIKEPEAPTTPAKAPSSVPESTTPSHSKAAESPSGTEKKKKNRLSAFIGKLKSKVHSK